MNNLSEKLNELVETLSKEYNLQLMLKEFEATVTRALKEVPFFCKAVFFIKLFFYITTYFTPKLTTQCELDPT